MVMVVAMLRVMATVLPRRGVAELATVVAAVARGEKQEVSWPVVVVTVVPSRGVAELATVVAAVARGEKHVVS